MADPYRWLEADIRTSPEVADWVAAENKVTAAYLEAIPQRAAIRRRLTELWNFAQYSSPMKEGGRYYYFKNDGLQNQAVLYVMDSLDGQPRVLLDPNQWSKDGTIALAGLGFSDDGRYLAYARAEAGSDWSTWHVMEIATGKLLPDELKWTKFSHASWTKDGKGFFYTPLRRAAAGRRVPGPELQQQALLPPLGTPQSADVLVYWRPEHPEWRYDGRRDRGRPLPGHRRSAVKGPTTQPRCWSATWPSPTPCPIELIDNFEHEYTFVGNDGPVLFFKTDADAPRRRLVAIDLGKPEAGGLEGNHPAGRGDADAGELRGQSVHRLLSEGRCQPQVKVFSLDGQFVRDVALAGHRRGRRLRRQADRHGDLLQLLQHRHAAEHLPLRHDHRRRAGLVRRAEVKFNPDDYEVKQVFYHSKDGTRVPMFIAYKKGIKLDGSNPTLLYGYGGFNISLLPTFSVSRVAWMEMGGVYAQPNLRGGGEYGEAWHQAGTKLKKQNVFDDFIAAAEWLIAEKYTRPDKLAIQGGSNGGLLVGAVMTQRPELFGACLPAVGVMDMLRFHKFTEGRDLGRRLRLVRQPRAVQGPAGLFALSQHQAGHVLSGHAGHHGRHRRPRGARPQLQVRRRAAARPGRATPRC